MVFKVLKDTYTYSHNKQEKFTHLLYVDDLKTYHKSAQKTLLITPGGGGGGTLGISGWGCAAGTLEPLAYTRASSAEY